jgi:hypothetical protein
MEETLMNMPEGLKPALYGAAAGAVALAIVGFSWGGWVTGGTANLQQSSQDPGVLETLALLKDASRYQRSDMLMEAGWATMPGSSDPNRNVASACMEKLAAQF